MNSISKELHNMATPEKALQAGRFFKTGKGEYSEGDKFLGLTVPEQRIIAKKFKDADVKILEQLLKSQYHEERLTALLILTIQFEKAGEAEQKNLYDFYFKNLQYVNNWDLIDGSAPKIVGQYLLNKPTERKILYELAVSKSLWEKRIAILSTYTFIKNRQFEDCLKISEILLKDNHDLIHKAVGWMLRELGKMDQKTEEVFLKKHLHNMPRTMLRYAIERFDEPKRLEYLRA